MKSWICFLQFSISNQNHILFYTNCLKKTMSDLNKCEFICIKKKRQCKLLAAKGNRFCGEHLNYSDEKNQVIASNK